VVPAVVVQAASVALHDRQGVIGYRIHQTSAIDGGPFHQHDDVLMVVVADGPNIVKVRVLHFTENGAELSDKRKTQLANDLLAGQAKGGFAVPFDSRHFPEYTYSVSGPIVSFKAIVRNADHGDGTFQVDAGGHVVRMVYKPDTLPKYANWGSVTVDRAEVVPGFWATTRSDSRYRGGLGFIRGGGSFVADMDGYRRFASLAAAEAALASGSL
jgi:hypothetical protein